MWRITVAATTIAAALGLPAAGHARSAAPRPDLTVPSGTVSQGAALAGMFKVKNAGKKNAGTFRVILKTRVSGKDRTLKAFSVASLKRGKAVTIDVRVAVPALPTGTYKLKVCVDVTARIREHSEGNNCASVGRFTVAPVARPLPSPDPVATPTPQATPAPQPTPTPQPTPEPQPTPTPTPDPDPQPETDPTLPGCGSAACAPIAGFQKEQVFTIDDAAGKYWIRVPAEYDSTHATPMKLLVWGHGCFGRSSDAINSIPDYWPESSYIAIATDGAEFVEGVNSGCWDMSTAPARVLTAIKDVRSHFNIDAKQVVIGGYSSGGDLAYRMAFTHAKTFAGVLAMNTSPFRDTGLTSAQALAAATWRFNVLHILHLCDHTYDTTAVRAELQQMRDAGWALTPGTDVRELPGHHYDQLGQPLEPPDTPGCAGVDQADIPDTAVDIQSELVRKGMALNWNSPGY